MRKKNVLINFVFTSLLLIVKLNATTEVYANPTVQITGFYSSDVVGILQDYFPIKTTVYFNVTLTNLTNESRNVSICVSVHDSLNLPIGIDCLDVTISANATAYYVISVFIPKWASIGVATAYATLKEGGTGIDTDTTEFYIGPEDKTPPEIHILSPENTTYVTPCVPLTFTVNEQTSIPWMGYSLNSMENITITGNTSLIDLPNGAYNIIVYANDTSGNIGSSENEYFTILVVHDVAVVNVELSSIEIVVGQTLTITVIVQNEGNQIETFNVTAYRNTTAIQTKTVTDLAPLNQTTLNFTWDTTGVTPGNYTISAHAHPVEDETDTTENTLTDGVVNIKSRPDIAVTSVTPSKTLVGQGYPMYINVTVENQGDYTEAFNVTTYANATSIDCVQVILESATSTIVTFTWNTTGFAKGNYTLSAYAHALPDETNTTDNALTDGTVLVTILGDVNGDKKVRVDDVLAVAMAFGSQLGHPRWNPNVDLNDDNKIRVDDVLTAALHFGETDP